MRNNITHKLPAERGTRSGVVLNLLFSFGLGFAAFGVSAIIAIVLAFATDVVRPGICGITDGRNAGLLGYILFCAPFIAAVLAVVKTYGWLDNRQKMRKTVGIGPVDT